MTGSVFSTETDVDAFAEAPYPSVTEARHVIVSEGCAVLGSSVTLDPVPNVVEPLVQRNVADRVSRSASNTDAEQFSVLVVCTPDVGDTDTEESVGAVFSIITEALEVACSPVVSVAVMVQSTTSVGEIKEGDSVMEEELPITVEPTDQA